MVDVGSLKCYAHGYGSSRHVESRWTLHDERTKEMRRIGIVAAAQSTSNVHDGKERGAC